jgi:hypothetical protein
MLMTLDLDLDINVDLQSQPNHVRNFKQTEDSTAHTRRRTDDSTSESSNQRAPVCTAKQRLKGVLQDASLSCTAATQKVG